MPNYTKETIRFLSADGKTQVAGYYYAPETPKAIIQISHGMCEYVERYEPTRRTGAFLPNGTATSWCCRICIR